MTKLVQIGLDFFKFCLNFFFSNFRRGIPMLVIYQLVVMKPIFSVISVVRNVVIKSIIETTYSIISISKMICQIRNLKIRKILNNLAIFPIVKTIVYAVLIAEKFAKTKVISKTINSITNSWKMLKELIVKNAIRSVRL